METLKKGSKGESVKTLQKLLNITQDGIFGEETEKKVIEFQKSKGLTADGIVGNATWTALGITSNGTKCVDPSVIYKPLTLHISKSANRPIKYLAIHFTAGANSKPGHALGVYNTFMKRQASADFAVDDRDMVQFNPDLKNYYCWAVGDKKNPYSGGGSLYGKATNKNTISIEICSSLKKGTSASAANHDGWYYTEESINNAIKLSKILMKNYNIPLSNVVRHYDISGKLCPGIVGWNNAPLYNSDGSKTNKSNNSNSWEEFKKKLSE